MGFKATRNRLEAILATLTMPTGTIREVSDSTPLALETADGVYTFIVDLPAIDPSDEYGLDISNENQVWQVRVVAPETSASQDLVQQAEDTLLDIADVLLDAFVNSMRLSLSGSEFDNVGGVTVGRSQFIQQPYPTRNDKPRYQFIMPITLEYTRG